VNHISDRLNIPLVLASGTPSVTSMYKSVKGEYKQVTLLEKYKRPE
jgi:primosomal protein N'